MHDEDVQAVARDLLGFDAQDLADAMTRVDDEIAFFKSSFFRHPILSKARGQIGLTLVRHAADSRTERLASTDEAIRPYGWR